MIHLYRQAIILIVFLVSCLLFSFNKTLHAENVLYSGQDIYPQNISRMYQFKFGYVNDRLEEDSFYFISIKGDFRLKPKVFSVAGGGYIQSQFPISLYFFDLKNTDAYALDVRYRPEIGPPMAKWLPLMFPEIGYLYNNKDWYIGREEHQTNTLLIGGMFRFILKDLRSAAVELGGQKSLAGDDFLRFSCYMHWFLTDHFGLTLHGDNFIRDFEGMKKSYSSFVFGVVYK